MIEEINISLSPELIKEMNDKINITLNEVKRYKDNI